MKKTIFAFAALLAASIPALASDYYIVMPVPGKTVNASAISVALSSASLPGADIGTAYSYDFNKALSVTGDPQYTGYGVAWAVVQGTLPAGLTLDGKSGVLSGTPTTGGTSAFTVQATYKTKSGQQAYQLATTQITVTLAAGTLPGAEAAQAYSYALTSKLSIAGDQSYSGAGVTWAVVSGALPAGVTLNAQTGALAGTPSVSGTYSFTVNATYKSKVGQQGYQLSVAQATPRITIQDATFGSNVAVDGNITTKVAALCNTKTSCSFNPADLIADPYPGVRKGLLVHYSCNGTAKTYQYGGPPEAGGVVHTLSCP